VKKGANTEAKDEDGSTPLHWASAKSHLPVVEHLVKKGADTEAKDEVRHTDSLFSEAQ